VGVKMAKHSDRSWDRPSGLLNSRGTRKSKRAPAWTKAKMKKEDPVQKIAKKIIQEQMELRQDSCRHESVMPKYDDEIAKNLTRQEILKKYPRYDGPCPDCGQLLILYASPEHFAAVLD